MERFTQIIESARANHKPTIQFIRQSQLPTSLHSSQEPSYRLGIFASSFNPVTRAHLELMQRAKEQFAFDETLALAGMANADKSRYDCALEDRLRMLEMALQNRSQVSIGLSSHAFFVDMLEALEAAYEAPGELHFVVGFDTFERVLDPLDKYTKLYHWDFTDRNEALEFLLTRSRFIVAGRRGAKHREVYRLAAQLPATLAERIFYMDFPDELAEHSATEARRRLRAGLPIDEFVPDEVARYIQKRGLYG